MHIIINATYTENHTQIHTHINNCILQQGKVWRLLIDAHVLPLRAAVPSNYYKDLLARHTPSMTDPSTKQVRGGGRKGNKVQCDVGKKLSGKGREK